MTPRPAEISVVIPTRNRRALLATTLRGVLQQRDVEFEVIVVDEASTDDTPSFLAALDDRRLRTVRHDMPKGVAAARNRGGIEARGEWIAYLDDDDLWAPDKLAAQLQAAESVGRDWAYSGAVNIIDNCKIVHGSPPLSPDDVVAALPRYDAIPGGGSNVLVRRTTWRRAGFFDTRLRNTEDWEMWIRLSKLGRPACVSRPLVARRLHRSNSSQDIVEIVRGAKLIESIHGSKADWGQLHLWMAESCQRNRQHRAALAQYLRAAAYGQWRPVVAEFKAIARRRLLPASRAGDQRAVPEDSWRAEASTWLRAFQT